LTTFTGPRDFHHAPPDVLKINAIRAQTIVRHFVI
jgi:hypothetical protein